MVYFQTEVTGLVHFWKAFECYILISFMAIWYSLWPFALFYGSLVYFVVIYVIYYPHFGILYHEKSGNPDM
jgi:hypothetical protein